MSKATQQAADIAALLRARNPLLWIVTREEARVETFIMEAAASVQYMTKTWDVGQGVCDMQGNTLDDVGSRDPGEMLDKIAARGKQGIDRCVWIMRDLPPWLNGPGGIATMRTLRNVARRLPVLARDSAQAIIILSPDGNVPAELSNTATVIEWPLPDREEMAQILTGAISVIAEKDRAAAAPNGTFEAAIDAAIGLSAEEAMACYAKSLVQHRRIDPATVAQEKKRVVARERVLEWYDPIAGGLEAVGGLDQLKTWLVSRKAAYSPKARAYGLPAPKGAMLVGIPGCGKSLTAKAVATAWGVPLLKLDLGALKSKFVGESEGNLRRALRTIEAIGRCVVWLDEIEKALAGATGGGADGGVSVDALGTVLTWMQERAGEAFVIATANDVTSLPPELMRKGRFDEIWWVGLPTLSERADIAIAALKANGRSEAPVDFVRIAQATNGFTGSEVASLIPDAMYVAFADGARQITTEDIVEAAETVTPMSKTSAEKIATLAEWAKGRARPATTPELAVVSNTLRQIEL